MKKWFLNIGIVLLMILSLSLLTYFINNYNQFITYQFEGKANDYAVNGNAVFNKQYQILNINSINYQGKDMQIKQIRTSLFAKIDNKERLIYASGIGSNESTSTFSLSEYLKKYRYTVNENYGYDEYFNDTIIKDFSDIIYFRIEYTSETGTTIKETIQLESKRYSNDKLFYFKGNHI